MQRAAKEMEFIEAARYRDQIEQLKLQLKKLK
jgi:excinuclease UvrABC nuclease subunit